MSLNGTELKPDRYYTPQIKNPTAIYSTYVPTPSPETVVFHKKARTPRNESCCFACLLACFLCCAVKGEDDKGSPQTN